MAEEENKHKWGVSQRLGFNKKNKGGHGPDPDRTGPGIAQQQTEKQSSWGHQGLASLLTSALRLELPSADTSVPVGPAPGGASLLLLCLLLKYMALPAIGGGGPHDSRILGVEFSGLGAHLPCGSWSWQDQGWL